MKTQYGIYEVEEEYNEDGTYKGFRCSVAESTGKQGKLFVRTDGRENYKAEVKAKVKPEKGKSEDLEI